MEENDHNVDKDEFAKDEEEKVVIEDIEEDLEEEKVVMEDIGEDLEEDNNYKTIFTGQDASWEKEEPSIERDIVDQSQDEKEQVELSQAESKVELNNLKKFLEEWNWAKMSWVEPGEAKLKLELLQGGMDNKINSWYRSSKNYSKHKTLRKPRYIQKRFNRNFNRAKWCNRRKNKSVVKNKNEINSAKL